MASHTRSLSSTILSWWLSTHPRIINCGEGGDAGLGDALSFYCTYKIRLCAWCVVSCVNSHRSHRRWLVDRTRDASRELDLTAEVLHADAKNYHAWSHRLWAVTEFGLWEGEVYFTASFLERDVRCNSAWHHRWVVVSSRENTTASSMTSAPDGRARLLEEQLDFVLAALHRVSLNESAWSYLRAVLRLLEELQGMPAASALSATIPAASGCADSATATATAAVATASSSRFSSPDIVHSTIPTRQSQAASLCAWPSSVSVALASIRDARASPKTNSFFNDFVADHVVACAGGSRCPVFALFSSVERRSALSSSTSTSLRATAPASEAIGSGDGQGHLLLSADDGKSLARCLWLENARSSKLCDSREAYWDMRAAAAVAET